MYLSQSNRYNGCDLDHFCEEINAKSFDPWVWFPCFRSLKAGVLALGVPIDTTQVLNGLEEVSCVSPLVLKTSRLVGTIDEKKFN